MTFHWGERTYVMGIINVSPDSFAGDGLADASSALLQARRFVGEGADILDLGGESTRPGSSPIDAREELQRVIPALEKITGATSLPVSIDSYKFEVVQEALRLGARMINDIWGLKKEPRLADLAAQFSVPIVLMSNQRDVAPHHDVDFDDIVSIVLADLRRAMDQAFRAGVPLENMLLDPGIGFGKTHQQNLEVLRRLEELKVLGRPLLLGTSRKSIIGRQLGVPPDQRMPGTAATVAIAIARGADMIRVHDVQAMVSTARMADAIIRPRS